MNHASCAINCKEGSIKTIIVVGGSTDFEEYSSSTELFDAKENQWSRGPDLPIKVKEAACVTTPSNMKYSCLVIGGISKEWFGYKEYISRSIFGLDQELKSWTHVGFLKRARYGHIILPIE